MLPNFGDGDDGRVELLSSDFIQMRRPVVLRNSLSLASLVGLGTALFGGSLVNNDDACWYGLSGKARDREAQAVFQQGGVGRSRHGDSELWFANLPNGIEGKGSHTHCDKLSVIMEVGGVPLLVDSGTGVYTRDASLRNELRSTAAHNTVRVDGEDQNTINRSTGMLFRCGNEASVKPIQANFTNSFLRKIPVTNGSEFVTAVRFGSLRNDSRSKTLSNRATSTFMRRRCISGRNGESRSSTQVPRNGWGSALQLRRRVHLPGRRRARQ